MIVYLLTPSLVGVPWSSCAIFICPVAVVRAVSHSVAVGTKLTPDAVLLVFVWFAPLSGWEALARATPSYPRAVVELRAAHRTRSMPFIAFAAVWLTLARTSSGLLCAMTRRMGMVCSHSNALAFPTPPL